MKYVGKITLNLRLLIILIISFILIPVSLKYVMPEFNRINSYLSNDRKVTSINKRYNDVLIVIYHDVNKADTIHIDPKYKVDKITVDVRYDKSISTIEFLICLYVGIFMLSVLFYTGFIVVHIIAGVL